MIGNMRHFNGQSVRWRQQHGTGGPGTRQQLGVVDGRLAINIGSVLMEEVVFSRPQCYWDQIQPFVEVVVELRE